MSNLPRDRHGIRSECIGCGEVFCGMVAFDAHRTGAGDARHCLSIVALESAWLDPLHVGALAGSYGRAEAGNRGNHVRNRGGLLAGQSGAVRLGRRD